MNPPTVLLIDLATQESTRESIDQEIARRLLGGKGIAAWLLLHHTQAGVDPLGEENALILATGPLTGTSFPQNRSCIVAKSPLTNTFCDSYVGGHIGAEIRFAGYEYIVIKGRSENLVHVHIEDEDIMIEDAEQFRGMGAVAHERHIREDNSEVKAICIGPAGENLVRFASISTDYFRHAGRGGLGAVMGSKNLKALSIHGNGGVSIDDDQFFGEAERLLKSIRDNPANVARRSLGTARSVVTSSNNTTLPTRNFQQGTFNRVDKISAETMKEQFWKKRKACFVCPTNCSALGIITSGKRKNTVQEGVDYENLGMLGSNLDIDDIDEIIYLNFLCDDLGLDTISTGNILGFLMECTENDVENIPVRIHFGDSEKAAEIIRAIAYREDYARILGEGLERLSRSLNTERYAMQVKGLELPAWEVRSAIGMALAYATSDRGGCHRRSFPIYSEISGKMFNGQKLDRYSPQYKAAYVKQDQDIGSIHNALIVCGFCTGLIEKDDFFNMVNLATGYAYEPDEFWNIGERIWNLVRIYNVREGFDRTQDTLPERFFTDPLPVENEGHVVKKEDFEYMLDQYYALRGWDSNGIPTRSMLEQLGLEDYAYLIQKDV
jgi:aldehyde:ferredoxin oxidoreductase